MKETLNRAKNLELETRWIEEGDNHVYTSIDTPVNNGKLLMSDESKITTIEFHFRKIMEVLGLDLNDDSLSGTPHRVAKMYVEEIFKGLVPKNKPKISTFENKYGYNAILLEKNISFHSFCEHHFLPIEGVAHVAYIPNEKVIGLSKINRIVNYFAQRPQVQERLTRQIANEMREVLETESVAVLLSARHMCVSARGIKDLSSSTTTSEFSGAFLNEDRKQEFYKQIA